MSQNLNHPASPMFVRIWACLLNPTLQHILEADYINKGSVHEINGKYNLLSTKADKGYCITIY